MLASKFPKFISKIMKYWMNIQTYHNLYLVTHSCVEISLTGAVWTYEINHRFKKYLKEICGYGSDERQSIFGCQIGQSERVKIIQITIIRQISCTSLLFWSRLNHFFSVHQYAGGLGWVWDILKYTEREWRLSRKGMSSAMYWKNCAIFIWTF